MPLQIPPELKKITQFVRRAEELDRDKSNPESRVVAYYCRQYAVQLGIPNAGSSAAAKQCLGEILGSLEKEKKAMSVFSKDEAKLVCKNFAEKIFGRADAQDRSGVADKNTARTFYAAATFYELLQQFYPKDQIEKSPEQEEEDEKRVYSKWKATDILKAIREGRTPTAGGYGDAVEDPETDDAASAVVAHKSPKLSNMKQHEDFPSINVSPPSYSPPPPPYMGDPYNAEEEGTEIAFDGSPVRRSLYPNNEFNDQVVNNKFVSIRAPSPPPPLAPPPVAAAYQPPAPPKAPPRAPPSAPPSAPQTTNRGHNGFFGLGRKNSSQAVAGGKRRVSKDQLDDATELTRFALAALEAGDSDVAVERLTQALETLNN